MGRPHKFRRISNFDLRSQFFQPHGIEEGDMSKIYLTSDELEALRLRHYLDLKQTDAADKMGISQTTYSRILNSALAKITKAIIEGRGIVIQNAPNMSFPVFSRGQGSGSGLGRGVPMPLSQPHSITSSKQKVIFDGWGCLDCGFQFPVDQVEIPEGDQKPLCPECKSPKTYRLIKKGL